MKKNSVFLRAFEPDDYHLINQWRNDFEVQKYVVGRFRYVSEAREKMWVEYQIENNSTNIYLAICLNDESKRMIGYTSINDIDYVNRKAEMGGIVLAGEGHNSKHLTDAYQLIFDYVFVDMSLHRLEGVFLEDNKNAVLMNKMLGWRFEGVERDAIFKNQKFHSLVRISMLDNEYFELLDNNGFDDKAFRDRIRIARKEMKDSETAIVK